MTGLSGEYLAAYLSARAQIYVSLHTISVSLASRMILPW